MAHIHSMVSLNVDVSKRDTSISPPTPYAIMRASVVITCTRKSTPDTPRNAGGSKLRSYAGLATVKPFVPVVANCGGGRARGDNANNGQTNDFP